MIRGIHGLFYSPNAEEVRAFIRDKLGFVHNDIGEGWLIFDMPEADLGFTPLTGPTIRSLSTATTFTRLLKT